MHYLVEDATYPLIALGLAALLCLLALQVSQQGKFLIWAVSLLGVGAGWFVVEWFVVTDAERVEAVVYDLAAAISRSDDVAVQALLTPDATFGLTAEISPGRRGPINGPGPVGLIAILHQVRFDFVKVRAIQSQAGSQTKRGSAEFKVSASGVTVVGNFGVEQPFAVTNTGWSLGFREVAPRVWRVTRITGISLPRYVAAFLGGR